MSFRNIFSPTSQIKSDGENDTNGRRFCYCACHKKDLNHYGKVLKENFIKYNLPIFLTIFLIFGLLYPPPGEYLQKSNLNGGICFGSHGPCVYDSVHHICIAGVFFISGMNLDTGQAKKALGAYKAFSLGMFLILILTNLMAFAVATSPLLRDPPEFAVGLAIFFAVPSTLNVGIAVTKLANGNVALASLLTVCSNFLGVFLVPVYVSWLLPLALQDPSHPHVEVKLDPVVMIVQLVFAILLPMIIGKLVRDFIPGVPKFTSRHKIKISFISSIFIALMPWMQASASVDAFKQVSAGSIFSVLFIFLTVHTFYFFQNYFLSAKVFKIPDKENKAVVIMGVQKSLPVCLSIIATLPKSIVPSIGLASVPIIISQLVQTFMDSILAVKWAEYTAKQEKKAKVEKEKKEKEDKEKLEKEKKDSNDGNNAAPEKELQNGNEKDNVLVSSNGKLEDDNSNEVNSSDRSDPPHPIDNKVVVEDPIQEVKAEEKGNIDIEIEQETGANGENQDNKTLEIQNV